jgi:ATP-dependent Clp protease ATP-binding subunit ClpC
MDRCRVEAMFVPFTDRARDVMNLAEQEARRLNHEYVGTEHILLGLFKAQPGVGATVLGNLGVEPERAVFVVESIALPGELSVGEQPLSLTPRARRLIEEAFQEAYELKHNYLGTEHLVLGTLRDKESVASEILNGVFGVSLNTARKEVLKVL